MPEAIETGTDKLRARSGDGLAVDPRELGGALFLAHLEQAVEVRKLTRFVPVIGSVVVFAGHDAPNRSTSHARATRHRRSIVEVETP